VPVLLGTPTAPPAASGIEIDLRGPLGAAERDCAAGMVGAVLAHHDLSTAGVRVRLSAGICPDGSALIQVNLRVRGAPARVQVAGSSVAMAVAGGAVRLDRQIRRLTTGWQWWPWPDPQRPALELSGPDQIRRVKTYRLPVGAPCQAAAAMCALDYDAYLFTDLETGEDAVVYRCGPTGLRLARQYRRHPPVTPTMPEMSVNSRATATLDVAEAARRLGQARLPHLFFTDPATGRGNLAYRRYDGGVGLIRPADR